MDPSRYTRGRLMFWLARRFGARFTHRDRLTGLEMDCVIWRGRFWIMAVRDPDDEEHEG